MLPGSETVKVPLVRNEYAVASSSNMISAFCAEMSAGLSAMTGKTEHAKAVAKRFKTFIRFTSNVSNTLKTQDIIANLFFFLPTSDTFLLTDICRAEHFELC